MPLFGKIVVIKRNGTDGTHFPLTLNSCTFGRKKECDIRIQMPEVSKEHCKIEVNENKEAILINLSTVNPTQLNGSDCQQPVYLKHGDVFTIIDRSFRFEYPPLPLARKRISRSEEKETLHILHVQQVEQKLHPQVSEYKSSHISDEKLEWESQKTSGDDEQRTQEDTTGKNGTNQPTCKIRRSSRKSMSPFSTPYKYLKHVDTKPTEEHFSNKITVQQKTEYSPREDSIDIAASQTPHRVSAFGQTLQTEEPETGALENVEQYTDTGNQGINMRLSNPTFVEQHRSRRSPKVLYTYPAKGTQGSEETNLLHFQNVKENDLEDTELIKNHGNAKGQGSECLSPSCCIIALGYMDKGSCSETSVSPSTDTANVEVKTNSRNTLGSVEHILPELKALGESLETCPSPCLRQASGMLQTELGPLLGLKTTAEISAETEEGVTTGDVLMEDKYLKMNVNNKFLDTEQTLDAKTLEETKMESIALKDGHGNSKNPRSTRERRDFSSTGSITEKIITEESLLTARDMSLFKGVSEENVNHWPQENGGNIQEDPTTTSLENNFVMKNTAGSSCLSERGYDSHVQMPAEEEVASEMNISNQCGINRKSVIQKSPKKRKGGELDLLVQPLGKRKRVSFGGHLSPELFDKRLPPNSPLKRGAIPARYSLPYGNSPRAVLKKASGFGQCVIKDLSGRDQQQNTSLRKMSPATLPLAHRSPAASPHIRGRFSVSRVDVLSYSAEQQNVLAREMDVNKEVKTHEPSYQESQTAQLIRRSKQFAPKRTSLHRRSGAVDTIRAKRQSGASVANLIVSRSWAEVVKQGVPKSQQRTTSKHVLKRRSAKKMPTKAPQSNSASSKTPTRKVKGCFTTGHANSPAPIVIGKAHSSVVNIAARIPKVMFNYTLKPRQETDESFTGVSELFRTPPNWKQGSSLSSVQKSNMSAPEKATEIHTPEESGEMAVSPLNLSVQQMYGNQNVESSNLRKITKISSPAQDEVKVSRGGNPPLDEIVGGNSSLVRSENVGITKNPKQIPDGIEAPSEVKRLLRTPKQKLEPVEALSGVKRLMRTPKQKPEPVEALSGVKRLMRTPKQKPEPVEVLSGVKRLLTPPKQKPEPVEVLLGGKRLLRTPKQKPEPVEALSGVKRLMRTPKQKPEPVEALSGVKRLMRTPKQKPEPVEALSGVKRLMRTPKQKPEPVEALSGVKRLLETPPHKGEPVEADICSKHLNSIQESLDLVNGSKEKINLVADPEGIQRLFRTPKQKFEPVEDLVGISRILKTPRPRFMPADDYLGLQKFMAEPKQGSFSAEIDYSGVQELFGPTDGCLVQLSESVNEPCENSSSEFGCIGDMPEREESWYETGLEDSFERKSANAVSKKPVDGHDELEDDFGQISHSSLNRLIVAHIENTATFQCVPEKHESNRLDLQNGAMVDLIKEPARQGDPVEISPETSESLVSAKKPRKGRDGKSSFIEETSLTSRNQKDNEETKSEFTKINPQEKMQSPDLETSERNSGNQLLRKNTRRRKATSVETEMEALNTAIDGEKNISKRCKLETLRNHPSEMKEDVIKKGKGKKVHFLLEKGTSETVEEKYVCGDNSSTEKGQHSGDSEGITFPVKQSTSQKYKKKAAPVTSPSHCISFSSEKHALAEISKGGRDTIESINQSNKDLASLAKGECFQENHCEENSNEAQMVPQENMQIIIEHSVPKRQKVAVAKKNFPRRGRNIAASHEPPKKNDSKVTPKTRKQHVSDENAISSKENLPKRGRKLASVTRTPENLTVSEGDPSTASSGFAQGKSLQVTQNEENSNEAPNISSDNAEASAQHSLPKRQKESRGNPPRRGRSKKVTSEEPPAEKDNKEAPDIENVVENNFIVKENQPKRGRGRKLASVTQAQENLTVSKEDPSTGSSDFAQGKCLEDTQNEASSNETLKVPLDNSEASAQHILPTIQKVSRGNPPRRGRSKKATSEEPPAETPDIENQSIVVENTSIVKETQPKRGRRRKLTSVTHPQENLTISEEDPSTGSFSFADGKCLQDTRDEENSNEAQKVLLDNTEQILPKIQKVSRENLPRRGRSKQAAFEIPPVEKNNKEAPGTENQGTPFAVKENQPKRGRGRKRASVTKTLENITVSEGDPSPSSSGFSQGKSLQDTQNEDNSNEALNILLDNTETSAQHILPKSQKVSRENPPRRGRRKQLTSEMPPAEKDNKEAPDTENRAMFVENTFAVKENQPKRSRGRKLASVTQTQEKLTVSEEDPSTGSFEFAQGKSLQDTQNEGNSNEAPNEPLDNTEASAQHILPKSQKVSRENPPRRGRRKQLTSEIPPAEKDNKEAPDTENRAMFVENTFAVKENQPKRGRGRKLASVTQTQEKLTVSEEDPSTGSFEFAQGKSLQDTQNEDNSNEAPNEPLDNTESSAQHILPKSQKVSRGNPPRRGRSKQVTSEVPGAGKDNKEAPDSENKDMFIEDTFAIKENQPKRGRGRKLASLTQILFSPPGNDSFPLSRKDKSAAKEQDEALEIATTSNENLAHRGRSRETEKTVATSSVPASKKPKVVINANQEEMASVLKDIIKENLSKRGRKNLLSYEVSTENSSQQSDNDKKPALIKDKNMLANSVFENQSKRGRGKKIILAFQTPSSPALKISTTLSSSLLNKNKTASENQNLFNVSGKENLAISGRNKKTVPCSTSVKRKCTFPEEANECQEKQNVNVEKISVLNDKNSRRGRRKVDASEIFSQEKDGLPESSGAIPKDQKVILVDTISGIEDTSQGRRKRIHKGKSLPKHSDQNNNLEGTLSQRKEKSSEQGSRKQDSTEAVFHETHFATSGMKQCFAEKTSVAGNTGSTLQRGRKRKMEEHPSVTTVSAVATQSKMKASRRTRKQVL